MKKQRLVVGISGSSGAILGIRLLEALKPAPIETHLIVTPSARLTIEQETDWKISDVLALADASYKPNDISAAVASGSFDTLGMVVIPCSIKSLSAIANSYSGDLLTRAADVTLKEGRPLLLVLREAPLHAGHLRLMRQAVENGAVIFPPVPAFYARPQSLDEIVNNIVGRVLSRMGIENDLYFHWQGMAGPGEAGTATPAAPAANHSPASGPILRSTDLWDLPAMTLATVGPNGAPHAAAVYFAADEERRNLYFFSSAGSQHSQDLIAHPRAAAEIHPLVESWQDIQGLQLHGEVHAIPPGETWEQAWSRYLVKFPFTSALKDIVAKNSLYTFRPDWIRMVDNRLGFGHQEEWTLNDTQQQHQRED